MVLLKNFNLSSHYQKVRNGSLIYSFRGNISDQLQDIIFLDVEEALGRKVEKKIYRKKIFNVMVEMVQNLCHHSPVLSSEFKESILIIQKTDDGFEVISGNFLDKKLRKSLETRANMINFLTSNQLDELYRQVLSSGGVSSQNGAGLGFIDVARRSGTNVDLRFDSIDDETSFFTLKAFIKANS